MGKRYPNLFAITMGDPAGIGPEISLKIFATNKLPKDCNLFIIGDAEILNYYKNLLSINKNLNLMESLQDYNKKSINVLDLKQITLKDFIIGKPQAICGRASYNYIIKAIRLCLSKKICGIITNPINKEALHLAKINYPGHTEILAKETNTKTFSMMFALENVYVVHVTTHVSLKQAINLINKKRVLNNIILLNDTLKRLGFKAPKIAVGGLNPHAGENGLFGSEEIQHILPAIKIAQQQNINVSGPYPPDTVFMRAFKGEFNGVVSMLHDHGFVALKSRNFEEGVNITIGLPIIRTSVGHGTAYDKAGKGIASENSLVEAIRSAVILWKNRNK
jgi:4-hydroxythreonine-4-phosphate dehydrogenase